MNPSETPSRDGCASWSNSKALAAGLSALSHPVRLEILKHLSGAEACCCKDIVSRVDLAQSTVSQHLKILVEAGLVRFATDRRRSLYEINVEALADRSAALARLVGACGGGRSEKSDSGAEMASLKPKAGTQPRVR